MCHASNYMFSFLWIGLIKRSQVTSCQIHMSDTGEALGSATEAAVRDDVLKLHA